MFNLAPYLDLAVIWGGIIALAVFMYVLLDGFDLGVGILFPFAPTDTCRDKMRNSIAPFWDGNETWLVLGGGGAAYRFSARLFHHHAGIIFTDYLYVNRIDFSWDCI